MHRDRNGGILAWGMILSIRGVVNGQKVGKIDFSENPQNYFPNQTWLQVGRWLNGKAVMFSIQSNPWCFDYIVTQVVSHPFSTFAFDQALAVYL